MVVNSCEIAKNIDKEYGIVSYADAHGDVECVSHEDSQAVAANQQVWQKLMTTSFNPNSFAKKGKMTHIMQYRSH